MLSYAGGWLLRLAAAVCSRLRLAEVAGCGWLQLFARLLAVGWLRLLAVGWLR